MKQTVLLVSCLTMWFAAYGQRENIEETGPGIVKNDISICYGLVTSNSISEGMNDALSDFFYGNIFPGKCRP